MKKLLLISFTVVLLAFGLIFNQEIVQFFSPEKPVQKEISFMIGAYNNYSSKAYESSYATVQVTVTKISNRKETVIWSKAFVNLPLNKYSALKTAVANKLIIPDVLDKKEKLMITYTITYNTKGSILQMAYETEILKGQKNDNLFINI